MICINNWVMLPLAPLLLLLSVLVPFASCAAVAPLLGVVAGVVAVGDALLGVVAGVDVTGDALLGPFAIAGVLLLPLGD